ncbi:MAG: 4-hydroxy-tetrahydrodipicolinate reductase [Erysipelotrichaceae bacterium]|nr:4-hydroxy-tetrahydrodipicolinate reductase [Erysipelotrichaceae bacterium]
MKVIVYGYGLMGKKIYHHLKNDNGFEILGVVSKQFDEDIEESMYDSLKACEKQADVIIDFSHPDNLEDILNYALKNNTKLVLATTGYTSKQLNLIEEASLQIPIFQSFNTSFGIQMMTKILRQVTKEFFDNGFDIEIVEKHHNQKIDAPSGTAKLLYEVMNEEVDSLKPVYDRSSMGKKREHEEVGLQAMRGGTIFGEHTVMFAGNDEVIEIKHTALSKEVFVLGAIHATKLLKNKEKGLYTLKTLY